MTSKVSREKTPGIQWQQNKRKRVNRIIYTQRTDGGWDTDEKWDVKTNQQKVKTTRESGEERQGAKLIFKVKQELTSSICLRSTKQENIKRPRKYKYKQRGNHYEYQRIQKQKTHNPTPLKIPGSTPEIITSVQWFPLCFFYLPCFSVVCIQTHPILAFLFTPTHTELQTCLISACKALHYAYFHKN